MCRCLRGTPSRAGTNATPGLNAFFTVLFGELEPEDDELIYFPIWPRKVKQLNSPVFWSNPTCDSHPRETSLYY